MLEYTQAVQDLVESAYAAGDESEEYERIAMDQVALDLSTIYQKPIEEVEADLRVAYAAFMVKNDPQWEVEEGKSVWWWEDAEEEA